LRETQQTVLHSGVAGSRKLDPTYDLDFQRYGYDFKSLRPGRHQQRILGVITGPLTRFSGASHDAHSRTKPGPGYSARYGTG
jgi:hypothetical protein